MEFGSGDFRYELAEGWGQLPSGWQWGQIAAVAVDSQDRVYVYTRTNHPMMIFDRSGNFIRSWGETILPKDPHGLCLDAQNNMFLVDREGQVVMKFTADGKKVFELGTRDKPSDTGYTQENRTVLRAAGPFHHPTDIALSSTGDFYVSDGYRNARVHKFSPDGKLLFSWGEPGTGPGQFRLVHGIWEAKGRVYVADRQNNRIQIFTPEGRYLDKWDGFLQPMKIFVDAHDIMYVPELEGRISILDLKGKVLARWGSPDDRKAEPGKFVCPHGIWADKHGDFYVSEVQASGAPAIGQRIQKFVRKH
ncbi:MAG: peptidyl-alpha-hydroxyglycine alpha-amidating lyase family protein [Chloroflexota bacterium]